MLYQDYNNNETVNKQTCMIVLYEGNEKVQNNQFLRSDKCNIDVIQWENYKNSEFVNYDTL